MKIGPSHNSGPLNRPKEESVGRTPGESKKTEATKQAKGVAASKTGEPPIDRLQLSVQSGPGGERVGYDSHELRDQLVAARSQNMDSSADSEVPKGIDSTRLDTIRELVKSGFYERKEITQQVAAKLADAFIGD